jgi:predicted DNA-binding transcriptional regulator YafY
VFHATRLPLRRFMAIDQALRANAWPNATRLSLDLEVSGRTILRDVAYMRDQLGAPIEFDPARNGYCYTDPTFRLPYFQMSEGELVSLYLAERVIQQLRGTPFEADLRRAIGKLNTMLVKRDYDRHLYHFRLSMLALLTMIGLEDN